MSWELLQELARTGTLSAAHRVWTAGMAEWAPAATVPGLLPAVPLAYAPPPDRKQAKIIRNAKQNCYAMFVIFLLALLSTAISVIAMAAGGDRPDPPGLVAIGGIFAAIYLPVRWKVIRQLHPLTRTLGLIGGFGLIGLLVLSMLVSGAIAAFAP